MQHRLKNPLFAVLCDIKNKTCKFIIVCWRPVINRKPRQFWFMTHPGFGLVNRPPTTLAPIISKKKLFLAPSIRSIPDDQSDDFSRGLFI